jgi:3-phosphoglycerate kinase
MAYTFKLAQGAKVGLSLVEKDKTDIALQALAKAKARGIRSSSPPTTSSPPRSTAGKKDKKGRPKMDLTNPA